MPTAPKTLLLCVCGCAFVLPAPAADPDAWCPSGRDLDEYLEARRSLPRAERAARIEAAPPSPVVTPMGGVLLIEDAGRILRRDRVFDLPMESIEYVPSGDGYDVFFIPPAYESLTAKDDPLFAGQSGWVSQPFSLRRFAFPFGGVDRTDLWVTSTDMIAFEPPSPPVKVGLCSTGCYFDEGQVLLDRLPRVSPLQHGTSLYGWNAFVREERDRVVVTWRYDDPTSLDVQAVLFADGRIRFNYAAVDGILHGATVVVTGNDAFWNDLRLGGDATDPAGDVPIAAPDGPALDIVGAIARQVGTSELLRVELTLAAPPPANNEQRLFYQIELRDEPGDPDPLGSVMLQWQNGQFYWMTEPAELDGSTLRFNLRLLDLGLADEDVALRFKTFRGDRPFEAGDQVDLNAVFVVPAAPMMLDLTADLPVTLGDQPIYEAFTLPSLQTGEVLATLAPLFEDPAAIEAFPIYQNLWTDIIFFAGGYHAGGNAGVDGIGSGSSAALRSPSLLHVNNIYNYSDEQNTMLVLSHEFGHRWLYHFAIEQNGQPSRVLNPAGSHPAGWVHLPAVQPVYLPLDYSLMGGSNWQDNGDGTFSSPQSDEGVASGFSWHELYLLGLAAPEEVADWWYIEDSFPPLPNAYWAPNGATVLGQRVPVTVDQIVAAEGPRFPAYPDTPRYFLAPIVLVARPGEFTPAEIDTVRDICNTWTLRFNQSTAGRADVRCLFEPPQVSIVSPPANVNVLPGDTVDFSGSASDGDGDAVEMRWDFSDAAPDTTGPGPHPVTFTSTGEYPVTLDGVDASGMLATSADSVLVTVDCPGTYPTGGAQGLRTDKESGMLRFTWTDLPAWAGDYVVLGSDTPQGPFFPQASAPHGDPGLLLAVPAGNVFYKVAVRSAEGCLGPY